MQRGWLFWCSLDFNVVKCVWRQVGSCVFSLCCKHGLRGNSLKCWDLRWRFWGPPWGRAEKPQVSDSVCFWVNPLEHQTVCWQTKWKNKSTLFKRVLKRIWLGCLIQTSMNWKRGFTSQSGIVRGRAMKTPSCVICKTLASPPKGKNDPLKRDSSAGFLITHQG